MRWLYPDASVVDDVEYVATETLRSLCGILKKKRGRLIVAQVLEDAKATSRCKFRELLGQDAYFCSLEEVMKACGKQAGRKAKQRLESCRPTCARPGFERGERQMNLIPVELSIGGVYLPPMLVAGLLGFTVAWLTGHLLNRYRLSRFFAYPPLVLLALTVVYTVIISTFLIPA